MRSRAVRLSSPVRQQVEEFRTGLAKSFPVVPEGLGIVQIVSPHEAVPAQPLVDAQLVVVDAALGTPGLSTKVKRGFESPVTLHQPGQRPGFPHTGHNMLPPRNELAQISRPQPANANLTFKKLINRKQRPHVDVVIARMVRPAVFATQEQSTITRSDQVSVGRQPPGIHPSQTGRLAGAEKDQAQVLVQLPVQLLLGNRRDFHTGGFLDDSLELVGGILDDLRVFRLVGKDQQRHGLVGRRHRESSAGCFVFGS